MKHRWLVVALIGAIAFGSFGCDSASDTADNNQAEATSEEEEDKKGLFDATYTVDTTVAYSAGDDGSWAYGNQRKEFPKDKSCYVRVGSTAKTDKKSGEDAEITVTYRFTGANGCDIKLTDGIATESVNSDSNVKEFSHVIYTKKKKDASEDVVIFQYQPKDNAEGVTLEILYDDRIEERYDVRNSIYFTDGGNESSDNVSEAETEDTSETKIENGIN